MLLLYYRILGNGLKIQWFRVTGNNNSYIPVNFLVNFSNTSYFMVSGSGYPYTGGTSIAMQESSKTMGSVKVYVNNTLPAYVCFFGY